MIRFPGGATDAVFADGMMVGGALPEGTSNMMAYAAAHGISVNFVVPVDTPDGMTRGEFLSQMSDFAAALEDGYPGVVRSFELGNEYWGGRVAFDDTLEMDYGQNAGEVALALASGMGQAGYDADIFLQAAGNPRGAFGNDLDAANGAIQAGVDLVAGAKAEIDGIIRNDYWRDDDEGGFDNCEGIFAEDRGLGQNLSGGQNDWEAWAGHPLMAMVGEYNINRNIAIHEDGIDLGIHGASFMLEHMSNMIDAGVDVAFAWPLSHNTQNAYLFRDETIETTTVHGLEIMTNTTRGAMLDLMRQTIAGHELVEASWSVGSDAGLPDNTVEVTLFEKPASADGTVPGEHVVFLSSRSQETLSIELNLSSFVTEYGSVQGISIHYEDTGGNLRDAVVSEVDLSGLSDLSAVSIDLLPYEVVQLVFLDAPPEEADAPPPPIEMAPVYIWAEDVAETIDGGATPDMIVASGGHDLVHAGDGDDFIRGALGRDTIYGGAGDDDLYGNAGRDSLLGEDGNDRLYGGFGRDTLKGGAGDDRLDGGAHDDRLFGGAGADTLHGGAGDDRLFGGAGDDLLSGGDGDDLLMGGRGHDTLEGGDGADSLSGGAGRDILDGGAGNDEIDGGGGNDIIRGGAGADRFFQTSFDRGFDVILDFELGIDSLVFDDPEITGPDDILLVPYMFENTISTLVRFNDDAGEMDPTKGGIILKGVVTPDLFDLNPEFPQAPEPALSRAEEDETDLLAALFLPPLTEDELWAQLRAESEVEETVEA